MRHEMDIGTRLLPLQQLAQCEFADIRSRVPARRGVIAGSRLVILPDRFLARMGGAASIYGYVCVSPRMLAAPRDVRRAVLAHEWGHVVRGHCMATQVALVLTALYAGMTLFGPTGSAWALVNIAVLATVTALLLWALDSRREFEADQVAVRAVGASAVAQGLEWARCRTNARAAQDVLIQRIQALPESQCGDDARRSQ